MDAPHLGPFSRHLARLCLSLTLAWASGLALAGPSTPTAPLPQGADPGNVTISGISSGAGMALQYAIAHSASVKGVATIAGPSWGCARGYVTQAINQCMCGVNRPLPDALPLAQSLAKSGDIDKPLASGRPQKLAAAFVFHSPLDATVVASTGEASADFLQRFIGTPPVVDRGHTTNDSDEAGHGILSPQGADACRLAPATDKTFVRRCGDEDNALDLFKALYPAVTFDATRRTDNVADADLVPFDQKPFVDAVLQQGDYIAPDGLLYYFYPTRSARRARLDMADQGLVYSPPACRVAGARCGLHVALHGCKQDVKTFARTTGYVHWAELYRVVVVFPAVNQGGSPVSESCAAGPVSSMADYAWYQPNPNGCWDWWGYLDGTERTRYLTKRGPQMQVLERIVQHMTTSP
ncbi:MAG: hypothetical protein RI907_1654 [Pseudomonadota bacterium]|jgi:poly(3-hydroxybutyrate) depolymerase